jgi:primosomal protein N' (replication factor Y) (superfamily II helicase)
MLLAVIPAVPMANTYDYLSPQALPVGARVQVPFGKRLVRGVVVGQGMGNCPAHKLKTLTPLIEPALSAGMVQFIQRAADYVGVG